MPRHPVGRHREAKDALLGHAHAVDALVAEREDRPGALVEQHVAAHRVGVVLGEPHRALAAAGLLVDDADDEQVAAGGAPARARERHRGGHLGRGLGLHVLRAATPEHAVDDVARPRVALPLGGVGQHGVDVREQAQRRPVAGPAQARHQVGALLGAPQQVDLEARVAQQAGEQLLRRALVARRVDRVGLDQALEELGRLALEVFGHRPKATTRPARRVLHRRARETMGHELALRCRRGRAQALCRGCPGAPAGDAHATPVAGRGRRPGAPAGRGLRAARRHRAGPPALDDPLRPAGLGQDHAGPDRGGGGPRRPGGAQRGRGRARRGAQGARARPAPPPAGRADGLLPRRDPPLQQGPAGRAAAGGRGGPRHAHRRHDREPLLRGQLRAALALPGLRAAPAAGRPTSRSSCAAPSRGSTPRPTTTRSPSWPRAPAATRARRSPRSTSRSTPTAA